MKRSIVYFGMVQVILSTAISLPSFAQDLQWKELLELTQKDPPKPDHRFYYGDDEMQFGDLWLPKGKGPHPVVVFIHGGCWLSSIPGVIHTGLISNDLRSRGYAVWNLEYRRVGHKGGGYPGTFQDVANGTDFIRGIAGDYHLDLNNIIAAGHSAGGHLVLWLSGRSKIDSESPLFSDDPLKLNAIISLAGIGDLEQFREYGNLVCAEGVINQLVNWGERDKNNPFSDTSPIELVQEETSQILIQAVYDPIVPPFLGYTYKRKLRGKNDHIKLITIDNSGHFELIAPWTKAWKEILKQIEQALHNK